MLYWRVLFSQESMKKIFPALLILSFFLAPTFSSAEEIQEDPLLKLFQKEIDEGKDLQEEDSSEETPSKITESQKKERINITTHMAEDIDNSALFLFLILCGGVVALLITHFFFQQKHAIKKKK